MTDWNLLTPEMNYVCGYLLTKTKMLAFEVTV